jgi:crotonobetaine/carnitine-CoA ligase
VADVAVHAVPSPLMEDDIKVTVVLVEGSSLTHDDLYRWSIDEVPYFALPRYLEFRIDLPRSDMGKILKVELREQGVTPETWDAETSGITVEKR